MPHGRAPVRAPLLSPQVLCAHRARAVQSAQWAAAALWVAQGSRQGESRRQSGVWRHGPPGPPPAGRLRGAASPSPAAWQGRWGETAREGREGRGARGRWRRGRGEMRRASERMEKWLFQRKMRI
eukprot:scaffold153830_cov35-Tisochrysis_lutea.AAC.1